MLGIDRRWLKPDVAACGNHPAFNDFIGINMTFPLANALASWVDAGVKAGTATDAKKARGIHSFQFWTRGSHKQTLIVGIIKDSGDSLGRIYPLLIMGQVYMKENNRQWPVVFDHFREVFRAFEEMTAARYNRFKEFETALFDIRFPEIDKGNMVKMSGFSDSLAAWSRKSRPDENLILPVPVFLEQYQSHTDNDLVQRRGGTRIEPPKAVFIGGLPEKPITAIYQRPLRTHDFCRLFDLAHNTFNGSKSKIGNG